MADLQKKIEARIRQAEDKDIAAKAGRIAHYLGTPSSRQCDGYSETSHSFKNGEFRIEDASGYYEDTDTETGGVIAAHTTEIYYRGEKVFDIGSGIIRSYVPGDWEKAFTRLHERALDSQKVQDKPEMPAPASYDDADLRRKWGL